MDRFLSLDGQKKVTEAERGVKVGEKQVSRDRALRERRFNGSEVWRANTIWLGRSGVWVSHCRFPKYWCMIVPNSN